MQSMPMGVLKSWWQPNTHLTQAFANNLSFQGKPSKSPGTAKRLEETVAHDDSLMIRLFPRSLTDQAAKPLPVKAVVR